jgi:hypothetical protein
LGAVIEAVGVEPRRKPDQVGLQVDQCVHHGPRLHSNKSITTHTDCIRHGTLGSVEQILISRTALVTHMLAERITAAAGRPVVLQRDGQIHSR